MNLTPDIEDDLDELLYEICDLDCEDDLDTLYEMAMSLQEKLRVEKLLQSLEVE